MTVIDTHSPVVAEEPPPVDEFVAGVLPRTYLSALEMHTRERARAILHVAQRFADEFAKTDVSVERLRFHHRGHRDHRRAGLTHHDHSNRSGAGRARGIVTTAESGLPGEAATPAAVSFVTTEHFTQRRSRSPPAGVDVPVLGERWPRRAWPGRHGR